ncbi:MAG TPA: helix-turn-helix transcriptional regulator, partial [Anaerolineales bacterium]|nr:helix-turn-helix transcriptional regulator [Anaerolineales bacterium]
MSAHQQLIQIRNRKLGVLIYDARIARRRNIEECATVMGISPDVYETYENGAQSPSLPELEALAFYLDIPLEHFWGKSILDYNAANGPRQNERLLRLRNRIVGAHIRMARTAANLTPSELSARTSIPEGRIKAAELGEQSLPLPELELLANALDLRIEDFFDQSGPVGKWHTDQQAIKKFLELSPEVQRFVCQP